MKATRRWPPLIDRLFAKLEPMPNGCIEFTGKRLRAGYGIVSQGPREARKELRAHRVAWEAHNGPISEGMEICHRCDNPPCCNPDHLYLGSKDDNMRDMSVRGRSRNAKKTHCVNGHPFSPENTAPRPLTTSGKVGRRCITCRDESDRRKEERRRHRQRFAA